MKRRVQKKMAKLAIRLFDDKSWMDWSDANPFHMSKIKQRKKFADFVNRNPCQRRWFREYVIPFIRKEKKACQAKPESN